MERGERPFIAVTSQENGLSVSIFDLLFIFHSMVQGSAVDRSASI
jgi:hypothetical protein